MNATPAFVTTNNLQFRVVSEREHYPSSLTDRWGTWLPRIYIHPTALDVAGDLMDRFNEDYVTNETGTLLPWAEGDPRSLLGNEETTFLAVYSGQLGILTEIELGAGEGDDTTQVDGEVIGNTTFYPPRKFQRVLEHWAQSIAPIQEAFPESEVFLAHGAPIAEDRLAICAFTPLIRQGEGYVPPYDADGIRSIAELDRLLNELVWETVRDRHRENNDFSEIA